MIYKKFRKIPTILSILFLITSVIGLAYVSAEIEIIEEIDINSEDGTINLISPTPIAFNNNTGSTNLSQFAEIWLTTQGEMDNIPDLYSSFIGAGFNDTINIFNQDLNTTSDVTFRDLVVNSINATNYNNLFLSNLSDVEIGTTVPATNTFLQFNATDWIDFKLFGNSNTWTRQQIFSFVGATIKVAERIEHNGDTNTFISFVDDSIGFSAGGFSYLTMSVLFFIPTFEINPSKIGVDFLYHANLFSNMFFIDASSATATFGSQTELAFVGIDGHEDEIQFLVQGFSTQTNNLLVVEDSSGVDFFVVEDDGKTNFTKNATFQQDVIIEGTLFGGSPVKIAGVNITDNVFDLMENRNSSSRFTLQNINESTNATTVISALNDVGGSMSIGIGSSNFIIGSNLYRNITALFSKSRGDMGFINFFNKPFVWLYNPQDDGDPNNLIEVMRLNEAGLNLSIGNITGNIYYAGAFFESSTGDTIELTTPEAEVNITGLTFTALNGFHNNTNHSLIVQKTGTYKVDISLSAEAVQSGGEYDFAMLINGVEQSCTEVRRDLSNSIGSMSGTCILKLNENDMITIGIDDEADPVRDIIIYYLGWTIVWVGH